MTAPTSLEFFGRLNWIDGKPLRIDAYRREIFTRALDTFRPDGVPLYNFVLAGRGKKNFKTHDLVLAGFYCLMIRESVQGSDGFILANDEEQAGNDLSLAKKLVAANPDLAAELVVMQKEIKRRDDRGSLMILPARDIAGLHGKTAQFLGYDEIHGYRTHDVFEALSLDPTRPDALVWITTYDTIYNTPGVPLVDYKAMGKAGDDPRMLFSWYSGDYCSDPAFAELEPELRANPSIGSWPEGRGYLDQQRRRLPTHKFRRLHLNLPGAPNGAFLDQGSVMGAIVAGRRSLPAQAGITYHAFVDMSGGSNDDATLSVAHKDKNTGRAVVDLVVSQAGEPPFNPRNAVKKFAAIIKEYRAQLVGDNYAGETFKADFEAEGIKYRPSELTKTELYEDLEPRLNAGEVELPDIPKLQEQLFTLVLRGTRVDHQSGDHDDWANAAAGAVWLAAGKRSTLDTWLKAFADEPRPPVAQITINPQPPVDPWRVPPPTV